MPTPLRARLPAVLACVLAASLGCRDAEADANLQAELDAALEQRSALALQVTALEAERSELAATLATERGCRGQLLASLSAFAAGPYAELTQATAAAAKASLEHRVGQRKRGEKLAIVLDVDETILSNIEQLRGSGYCFVREDWNAWVASGSPVEIAGIKHLIDYARSHEVAVVFLTGRDTSQREATERALELAGFEGWDRLILRTQAEKQISASEYKSGRRAALEAEGYTIALTLGDQQSDLDGGHTEQTMLMPNPFYRVE